MRILISELYHDLIIQDVYLKVFSIDLEGVKCTVESTFTYMMSD